MGCTFVVQNKANCLRSWAENVGRAEKQSQTKPIFGGLAIALRLLEWGYVCSLEEFETGGTHDPYWSAAQKEMVPAGKIRYMNATGFRFEHSVAGEALAAIIRGESYEHESA